MSKQIIPTKSDIYNNRIHPFLDQIVEWRSNGFNQAQVADELGVKRSTFRKYLVQHKELNIAWRAGEKGICEEYEAAAKRVSKGYKYVETKKEVFYDKDGNVTGRKITEFNKYQPPNPTMLSKSLEVLDPDKWGPQVHEETEIEIVVAEELLEYSE